MELSIIRHPAIVIALDVGSTYSGYAWQSRGEFETNRNNIHFNTNWGGGALQLHKTKSCMLIEMKQNRNTPTKQDKGAAKFHIDIEDIEKVRIGHLAEDMYLNKAKGNNDIIGNYYFFSRFKERLYSKTFHHEQLEEDQIGQPLPLMDVMLLFIKELKNHSLNKLRGKKDSTINESNTLFVVTVPAIWSENAKMFMRKAAEMAGIGKRNLLLALEPEAAAICCMHLPDQEREDMNNFDEKGRKFLVADLGGGTADLSALEVDKTGRVKELCEPLGNLVGGQNVNDAFRQETFDSFEGKPWKEIFGKATPVEMLCMEADFEKKKVAIGTDDDAVMVCVEIPPIVKTGLDNKTISLKSGASVRYDNPNFQFNAKFISEKLFKTTCKHIYDSTIKHVLDKPEASGISTVILVGGFVESQIVVDSLREMITDDFTEVKVVVPDSAFKAVLQGAVLYGHDPMIFFSRISRETYGVEIYANFDGTKHDASRKWKNPETGDFHCKDIFDTHVRKGQSVRLADKQPVKTYHPLCKEQKAMSISIYASESLNPKYITDEGCRKIGEINGEMPDTTGGTTREVEVTMVYGGTELSVITTDKTTGKEFNTNIQFHTD